MIKNIPSYKMSGDVGDLIYSLPIIKHLGAGNLYLNTAVLGKKIDGTTSGFTPQTIEVLIPLLEQQSYIKKVKIWEKEPVQYDIDITRDKKIDYCQKNLSKIFLSTFKVPLDWQTPWLSVTPITIKPIVIARSLRYHNNYMNWKHYVKKYQNKVIFVGLSEEHAVFEKNFGVVPYHPVKNFLELAQVIAGSDLFIGNQSAPYAIAEALKKTTIQEVCLKCPNCIFNRPNATYIKSYQL